MKFPTEQLPEFVKDAMNSHLKDIYGCGKIQILNVTGGGAFKFSKLLKDEMDLEVKQQDEMRCLVLGVNFLLLCCHKDLCFEIHDSIKQYIHTEQDNIFPYLLVNVGSGVSILKVTGPEKYQRVSGSLIGGGTFWGLCCLLTNYQSFDEMLEASVNGDHSNIDLYVKDIYGRSYESIGLEGDMMASAFGKVQKIACGEAKTKYKEADIAQALMMLVCGSVGHLGYEFCKTNNISNIYYAGGFIANNSVVQKSISEMIRAWSGNKINAKFLDYDGYFGALGSLLLSEYDECKIDF